MSEVKPVHRYKAQTLFSFGSAKIEYFPHGPEVVLATEFDAQRLRADTAEARIDQDQSVLLANLEEIMRLQGKLAAAEQRIALMSKLLKRCIPVCRFRNSHTTRDLIADINDALNPNPEAESHE